MLLALRDNTMFLYACSGCNRRWFAHAESHPIKQCSEPRIYTVPMGILLPVNMEEAHKILEKAQNMFDKA